MDPTLLDTDILSEILKQKNTAVMQKALAYVAQHSHFSFSTLTRYEIRRGLLDKNAVVQLQRFVIFCNNSTVHPITDAVLDRAADLWVLAGKQGQPRADADLLIAATALEHSMRLASGNLAHFAWIPGLTVDDWRLP